jgi:hypothetical protein
VVGKGKTSSYSVFEYAYIDGSNYKAFGEVWLLGAISQSQCRALVSKLESSQFFIAEQIPLPLLYAELFEFSNGVTSDDHSWHTFQGFRNELVVEPPTGSIVWGTVKELLTVFENMLEWQPFLSENFTACELV